MQNALIFHGMCSEEEYNNPDYPSQSNCHWLTWLQNQLLMKGYEAHTPEIARCYEPTYDKWLRELQRYEISEETTLIGHSCGGGFLLRWLSENPDINVGKVVLVAPWLNPDNYAETDMFEFTLSKNLADQTSGVFVYHSDNDMETINLSMDIIHNELDDIAYREFKGYGHFCYEDMDTDEFPELLKEIVS